MIPPLIFPTCIHALRTMLDKTDALEIHYADEDGDSYCVELAGRVGGFVVGNDSDFAVLNSEGYLGFVPFEDMVWTSVDNTTQNDEDDGDFQTVRKSKDKRTTRDPRLGKGLIPPDIASDLTLSFIVYKPSELAAHLKLPVTLLPLLGAFVGNDFSNQLSSSRNVQSLFFQRQLTLPQRINHVASTLNSILSASSQKRKPKYQVGSVMDLIDKAVDALLVPPRSTLGSGEVENIITTVVEATLQYTIPKYEGETHGPAGLWPTPVCALHEPDVCPLLPFFSRSLSSDEPSSDESEEQIMREEVRALYVRAYRTGWLSRNIMHVLSTGTSWSRPFLENPDLETVAKTIGRPIQQWIYAILEDGVGLPRRPVENGKIADEEDSFVEDEIDEDELVDVIEEDSETGSLEGGIDEDPLAFLRGELERLHKPGDDEVPGPPTSLSSSRASRSPRPKTIVEYVRRGTRITGEEVTAPFLADLLGSISTNDFDSQMPLQLRSEQDRLIVFLHALGSNIPSVNSLPSEQLMIALALRWVVRIISDRARSSEGSKDREKERWTKTEARAFLASFPWIADPVLANDNPPSTEVSPPIVDRNIQLTAQVLMAVESISDLCQVLLLTDRVPARSHLLSGKQFHSFLTGVKSPAAANIPDGLWNACMEGLEDAYGEERAKKGAKVKATAVENAISPEKGISLKSASHRSLFALLGDMEA